MNTFKKLKDTSGVSKTRLRKLSNSGRYYGMERSNPDKTNLNRTPYYLTVGNNKENWKQKMMSRFVRIQ